MITGKLFKVLAIVTSIASIGVSFLSDWVDDKKMDEKVETKVNEVLAKRDQKES